ncbi:MAG TPA: PAS domain S-box protein [Desulfomonilaceae bacterium]|nr:PAS domain S-box protein [Desulfomonilaceae bacterium]
MIYVSPVKLGTGQGTMTLEDITDRIKAEAALRESEEKYRIIFENSGTALIFIEDDSTISMNNKEFEKLSGYSAAEVEGRKKWTDFVARPEDLERMQEYHRLRRIDERAAPKTYEFQLIGREGNLKDVVITVALLPGAKQTLAAMLDITERKKGEEERMRLVTAIAQAAEGFVVTDKDWIIEYVNPAFERITGYGGNEIIGRHSRIFENNKHDGAPYKAVEDSLASGNVWTGRVLNRRKDGTFYEAEVTTSPVRDNSSTVINYVSIHRDITHEVKLEKELRQAQKMEAIGTLAGGIAHDFNNILMAISGYTELAHGKSPEGGSVRRYLDQVRVATARATDLVAQILTFSRHTEQERRPMSVGPIVKEALKLLRSSLPSTIEIRREIEALPEGGMVLTDPTQIHQVVMNLCTNAAHAMRANGGVLTVGLSCGPVGAPFFSPCPGLKPGPYLCLTVSDTGHGMDTSISERIFDPYFTTKGPGEGTGLGLAVVQGIVKSHGGAITMHSEPGQGTTFSVFLPLIEEEIAPGVEPVDALPVGCERVLFVDDENVLVDLGKEMLEVLGYGVTAKTGSLEALATFRARPDAFDLVITDMTMPDLTGKDLARELVAVRPDVPVILCSGFSELADGPLSREMGIREIVMKPYAIDHLAITIRKVLDEG